MTTHSIQYQRVPGSGAGAYEYSRLYIAADHLMLVGSSAWNESYRRFFFRDIQAFIIRKSHWGILYSAIWTLLFFLVAAVAVQIDDGGAVAAWCIACVFLAGLAINIARGPTCVCLVKTAVQTTKIAPLNRVRRARRLLEQLKPLIAQAQPQTPPAAGVAATTPAGGTNPTLPAGP